MKRSLSRTNLLRPVAASLALLVLAGGGTGALAAGLGPAPAQHPSGTTVPAKTRVPAALQATESAAEDIVDFALQRQRGKLVRTSRALEASAKGPATKALRAAGVPSAEIASLRVRAERVAELAPDASPLRVALAANRVSELMPRLYARFDAPVPPAVLALDYLDREAQLRSLAGEQDRVRAAAADLASTWQQLRTRVVAVGGRSEAGRYDAHVAAMKRLARSERPAALQREAVHGLELVDELERAFVR